MTARIPDVNGFWEVDNNPITKVGVFDYLGASLPGAPDPGRMYRVYRPASELGSPEFLDSLRLIPWIDEHEFLGPSDAGLTPPESKGVAGVVGERATFDGHMVRANVKVFSERLAKLLDPANPEGKRELSLGYRCRYDWTPGAFNGQTYDAVQRDLRGNHLALVREGRMGPDVAVLDHGTDRQTITLDSLEYRTMAEPTGAPEPTIADVVGMIAKLQPLLDVLPKLTALAAPAEPPVPPVPPVEDGDPPTPPAPPAADAEPDPAMAAMDARVKALDSKVAAIKPLDEAALRKSIAMDAAEAGTLARRLAPIVGVFDHAAMTHSEVAAYGLDKLGLTAPKGAEVAVLDAHLKGRASAPSVRTVAADAKPAKGGVVDAYLNPKSE